LSSSCQNSQPVRFLFATIVCRCRAVLIDLALERDSTVLPTVAVNLASYYLSS
jgi:hypothetical protein